MSRSILEKRTTVFVKRADLEGDAEVRSEAVSVPLNGSPDVPSTSLTTTTTQISTDPTVDNILLITSNQITPNVLISPDPSVDSKSLTSSNMITSNFSIMPNSLVDSNLINKPEKFCSDAAEITLG